MNSTNLNHLEAFCILSETLSFSLTAKLLQTSQPAISLKIKLLEESLGYELFIRNKKNIRLTQKGQELKDKIYRSYLNMVSVSSIEKKEETVKIGSVYEAGERILLPSLTKLVKKNKFPKFHLSLRSTDELIQKLSLGEVDFILIHKIPEIKSLHAQPIYKDRAILIGPKKSQLRDMKAMKSIPLVTYRPDDTFSANFIKENFSKEEIRKCDLKFSINSHRSMIKTVESLSCYAVIPQSSLQKKSREKINVLIEDDNYYQLYLCTRVNFLSSKNNQHIFETIVNEIKNR